MATFGRRAIQSSQVLRRSLGTPLHHGKWPAYVSSTTSLLPCARNASRSGGTRSPSSRQMPSAWRGPVSTESYVHGLRALLSHRVDTPARESTCTSGTTFSPVRRKRNPSDDSPSASGAWAELSGVIAADNATRRLLATARVSGAFVALG